MRHAPEIIEVDDARLEDVLRRVEQALDAEDAELVRAVFASYAYVADLVEDKNTTIRRLRQLFFGARTEKTEAVVGRGPRPGTEADASTAPAEANGDGPGPDEPRPPRRRTAKRGHGRNADHGPAAADGEGLCAAETAVPPVRPGVHRDAAGRRR
jgi:hypothetical protein